MKRSEAVTILEELLIEHTDISASCCNLKINEHTLGKVMQGLIKAGMLPPPTMTTTLGQWEEE